MRFVSIFLRKRKDKKKVKKTIETFEKWSSIISTLHLPDIRNKSIAIIRLDDIGDYILFRNFIELYCNCEKYKGYSFTLIGNIVWKEIFENFDSKFIKNAIWVDKNMYFYDSDYRMNLWKNIRNQSFETVICPSRTRPILLDDMIALASGAIYKFANTNTHQSPQLNQLSDNIYSSLNSDDLSIHEFIFNQKFANWITGVNYILKLPTFENIIIDKKLKNSVICFIGASSKSKRWPVSYWISLIKMMQLKNIIPVIAGGKQEESKANIIVSATGCQSVTGKTSLMEIMQWIAGSVGIISGDTMAAHISVSLQKNLVILSNGVNAKRFVNYEALGCSNVITLYSKQYQSYIKTRKSKSTYMASSNDMKSIKPIEVMESYSRIISV
jgi:ADP-heptose:LPS heptosyltransferase